MDREARSVVRRGYDLAAPTYLADRPDDGDDVALLLDFATGLPSGAVVVDAGCGAGEPVARVLTDLGHRLVGVDLSFGQLSLGRAVVPAMASAQGDLTQLPVADRSADAVVSFYAIIHVPRDEHAQVLSEVARVLRPGGRALLCLGASDNPVDLDPASWLGVPMFWSHFDGAANLLLVADAGLVIDGAHHVADPMGHPGHLFVAAHRPT
jgi:SAM-dependent methyltransferase